MSLAQMKIPVAIMTGTICFALGVGAGILGMIACSEEKKPDAADSSRASGVRGGPPGGMPPMGRGGGQPGRGPRMGGGGGGPMGGMFGQQSPKTQLATLVAKLEQLTGKPLALHLNEDQRAKLRKQLDGLDAKKTLTDEDAKKRLDAILDIVKKDKATLEAAGYRWPGPGGGGLGQRANAPNPFKVEPNDKRLKSLQDQLGKVETN
jgi:hypothetical protein